MPKKSIPNVTRKQTPRQKNAARLAPIIPKPKPKKKDSGK